MTEKRSSILTCEKYRQKTDKKNVMQVTMQHALKLFWRPKAIELEDDGVMSYEKS